MNSFDFSLYDHSDTNSYEKNKVSEPKMKSDFDFDSYESPVPKKEKSFIQQAREYGKTIVKGGIEGLSRLGGIMGSTQDIHGKPYSEQLEKQTENLEQLLPGEEGFAQSALRRGLREAPTALAFPGSTLGTGGRSILAGFFGEGAKELGLPEWAQTAAEITAYIGPDITKKLLERGSNAELIQEARKLGLTDEQITPLIQSEFKQKWLSKLAPKKGATQKALKSTKEGLGEIYEALENSPNTIAEISEAQNGKLINSLTQQMNKLPRELRDKIERDAQDLIGNKITGQSLINFWKDINSQYVPGKEKLGILKEPIKQALKSISPDLGKDFDMLNNLYGKYSKIASRLKPSLADELISGGEALGLFGSLVTGNYPVLSTILTEKAGRKLVQQMLINPRFQQLSQKSIVAMNQNKFSLLKKTIDSFQNELKKSNPKVAKKLDEISDEELHDLIMQSR